VGRALLLIVLAAGGVLVPAAPPRGPDRPPAPAARLGRLEAMRHAFAASAWDANRWGRRPALDVLDALRVEA
jgi:hypothetical protein